MNLCVRNSLYRAVVLGLALVGGASQGATLYSTDFESGIGSEWSSATLDSSVPDPFTAFSGRFGNSAQTLTVSNLTVSAQYSVFFDLYIIDSWDGGADRFNVDVAGTNVFNESFYYNVTGQSYPDSPDAGPANYGFGGWSDSIYRNVEVVFTAPSNAVPVSFYGTGLQGLSDESWGIDNVRIQTMTTTTIDRTSLPTGSATEPINWFAVTALRNFSATSATNAANYDLRGAGLDGTFDTADDALYSLQPSFSSGKTVTMLIEDYVPLQPGTYRFLTKTSLLDSVDAPIEAYTNMFAIVQTSNRQVEDLDNGSLGTADNLNPLLETPTGSGFLTATALGSLANGSDYDYWTFDAEAGDVISAWVVMDRAGNYPRLQLLNASGSSLQNTQNGTSLARFQNYTISTPGTYYLLVYPTYDVQPAVNYALRLDVGRNGRHLESEDNNNQSQANGIAWTVNGSSLKDQRAGALFSTDDYFNLGYLNSGNAMSVNLRFPAASELNSSNILFEIQSPVATLYATNTQLFAYDITSNTTYYLKISTPDYDILSQYVLDLTILDTAAPGITADTLPAEATTNSIIMDRFTVNFSEYMDAATLTDPASWQLVSAGVDDIFGNGDDESYTLSPSYSANTLSTSISISDGPLLPDHNYRFTALTTITDRVGNHLAAPYVREFRLENIPLFTHENRSNGDVARATPLGVVSNMSDSSVSRIQIVGVGDNPTDVISADLDGDLNPDLITCNYYSGTISILYGNGDGTFTLQTNLVTGTYPRQAALGHFNGDSYFDLAVANESSRTLSIFLGQAGGSFQLATNYPTANNPWDVKAGDLNSDGQVDLAVVNYGSASLTVFYGDGAGGFGSSTNYATGSNPVEVSLAFLDGDANLDVVVANLSSDSVSVFLNNGDGTLAPAVDYPVGDGPRCLVIGDLDLDTHQDLIIGNNYSDNISVLPGAGDGTFGTATNYAGTDGPADIDLIDLDSDGFMDLAVASYNANRLNFFMNQGDGTFALSGHSHTINYYPHSIAVNDFNGDGLSDLVLANTYYDQLYTYLANPRIELPEDPSGKGLRFGLGRGNITDSNDYDYWSFTGDAGDKIVMAIEVPGNPGSSGLRYRLVSPEGADLGSYSATSSGYGQSPPITLPSTGRYALMVYYNYSYWSEYRIRLSKVPALMQMESESNNGTGEADLLDFAINGSKLEASVAGYIGTATDVNGDYFSLGNLTSGTVVNVTLSTPSSSQLLPEINLLDPSGYAPAFSANQVLRLGGTAADYGIANPFTNFPTTSLTAEFWMKSADTTKDGTPVSYARSGQDNEMMLFDYRSFDPYIGGSSYNSAIGGNNDRWNHIAWTWDGVTGTSLVYKNGELVHSNGGFRVGYNLVQGGAFVVGQDQDVVGGNFQTSQSVLGDLDEIAIWDTVRSQSEIQSDLAASLSGSESGLVGYWNFEDGTANDLTALGNNLALFGNSQIITADLVSDVGNPASYPTTLQYTTTTNGIYYVRVRDALAEGDLLRQYIVDVSLQDAVLPFITAISLPSQGTNSMAVIDRFNITFSEEMDADSINNPANYDLRSAGADGLLDTADDEIYTLVPTYSTGLQASYIISDGPLQSGSVRLTASTGLLDRSGNPMSTSHVRTFTLSSPSGFVLENRDNGSVATATSLGSAIPGESDGSFIVAGTVAVGANPYAVAMADFNHDGHLDLATADFSSDSISVQLGTGDASFVLSTNIPAGDGPVGLEAGLFDGDADLDLAVVNYYSDTLSILLGDGAGGFVLATNLYAGDAPRDLSIADMNNDGKADIVLCNEYSDTAGILLGNGDGTFAAVVAQPCGDGPFGLFVDDLDGDGTNDVAVANNNDSTMQVLFGNGDGTLQTAVSYAASSNPRGIVIADIDQDSQSDIVVANFSGDNITLFRGLGGGAFTNVGSWYVGDGPWGDLSVNDFNGDGRFDLAVALHYGNQLAVLEQDSTGGFSLLTRYGCGSNPIDAAMGDLNEDGLTDFAVANYSSSSMSILLGARKEPLIENPSGSGLFSGFGLGNIASDTDYDYWSFSGSAGDLATVAISLPSYLNAANLRLDVYRPDGGTLTTFYGNYYGGAGQSLPLTLPVSGRYTVRVIQYYAYRGEYDIAIQLARPPLQMESEANDSTSTADAPVLSLSGGRQEGSVAGFALYNSGYDYYSLGNLASGTVVQASLELPTFHNMLPRLELIDPTGALVPIVTNGSATVLELDGDADYLLTTTTNFNPRGGTVEGWVFPRESYNWGFWQTHDSAGENWADWIAAFSYSSGTFYFRTGRGPSGSYQDLTFASSSYIPPYEWTHLAFTWGGTTMKVYVNGRLLTSRSDAILQDVMDPYARMGLGHGCWLDGWLDEMRVWDYPLSQAEIDLISTQPVSGSESGLVGSWGFNGDVLDASSSGNDGTLMGNAVLATNVPGPYDLQTNLSYVAESSGTYYVRVGSGFGHDDVKSQYIVHLSAFDSTMPLVTADTLPATGTTNSTIIDRFTVTFSEEMEVATVTGATGFELRSAGGDTLFGTGDDSTYALSVAYSSGLIASFDITDGPLQPGFVRFTAGTNVLDRSGTPLLPYTNTFAMANLDNYLLESRSNDSAGAADGLNLVTTNLFNGTYSAVQIIATGSNPIDVASGFFDGDANLDLAVVNYAANSVSILLGNGDTTFVSATNIAVGSNPYAAVPGLINGDAHLDLAVVNFSGDSVTILLGDGAGGFATAGTFYSGNGSRNAVLSDLNGDGYPDLAVANEYADNIGILLGNGDGTFAAVSYAPAGDGPFDVAAADFNHNGTNDLAVTLRNSDSVAVLPGLGDGTFDAAVVMSAGDDPRMLVAADFNLDGWADLACGNFNSDNVSILMAAGGGVFLPARNIWVGDGPWLSAQDVDGDTVIDLLAANQNSDSISLLFGDGFGQFSAPQVSAVGDGPVSVLAADFDSQPGLELAEVNYNDSSLWILAANTTAMLAADSADGAVRTQRGRGTMHNSSDIDYWTFDGQAGDQLMLAVDIPGHPTYPRLHWIIYRPDGVQVLNYYSEYYGYGQSAPVTLPVGGRYLMTVQIYDDYRGEYQFRLTTVAPPLQFESEDNNSTGNGDLPLYVLQPGSRSANMAGFIHGNDTSGDYFQLGNLGVGTTIDLGLAWPDSSTLSAALAIFGPDGQMDLLSPATNLVYVTATNGNFYARVSDAATTRGLDAQYLLNLSLSDFLPPEITSVSLPAEGTESTSIISSFTIGFSEAMDVTTVTNTANYELVGSGPDGLLDTADDEVYPLVPGAYSGGSSITMSISQPPLQPGLMRLTIDKALKDVLANSLTVPYSRSFSIADLPGTIAEGRENDTVATATPINMAEELPGLRAGTARGALLNSSDVDYFSFTASSNEAVVVGVDSPSHGTYHRLRFRLVDTNNTVLAELITPYYDERGQTAPFMIPADGTYCVRVSAYDDYRGEYDIHVMAATDPLPLETEDNGTIGSANVLSMTVSSSNATGRIAGYVGHVADNDYYAIGSVTNDQTILVGVRVPDDSGLVPVVSVYNGAGAYQTEEGATGDGSAEVRVTTSNTYYVVVRSGENTGGLGKDYIMDVEVLPTAAVVIPNLQVSQISPPSGSGIKSGDSVLASYIVRNNGTAPTVEGSWFDRIVLSSNKVMGDSDDYPLGTIAHVGNLDVGGAYTNQTPVVLPDGISGDFYIVVYTDFGDLVNERLFEGDNITASAATFPVALSAYPDLKVENLQVAGSNEVGQVLHISWNSANRGTAATGGAVAERLRILRADNGAELFHQDFTVGGPLAVDAVVPHTVDFTTALAVTHQVVVTTDYGNDYYEFDAVSHASAEQNSASVNAPVYNYYNVTVTPNPASGGSVSGGGHFAAGTIVTVTATVNTNTLPYSFYNWTENGAFRSASRNYAFLLSHNVNLKANFGLPQFTITAVRVPAAGGSVTGAGSYNYGTTNILRAYPNTGYGFDRWQEGAVNRGTAVTVTNVLYGNRTMTAYFKELNPYHNVTTASDPAGVASVSGAGLYTNGNSVVFAAPRMTTNGPNRYIFQQFLLNNSYLASTNAYLNTFSTLQPSNMNVVARYSAQSLIPQVKAVSRNLSNPVPATTNFVAKIIFDRSMQSGVPALVVFTNAASPAKSFIASSNGTWSATYSANDTYNLNPVRFGAGDDGDYGVVVSRATDLYGSAIGATNAATVSVNATPPDNPAFVVASSNATSVTLSWSGYAAPSDLYGFRLYRETNSFSSVANLAPAGFVSASGRSGTISGIQLDKTYYVAVAAVDVAGNRDPAVTGLMTRVNSVIPPPVPVTATGVGADAVNLSWSGYNTTGLFGLLGFRVYHQNSNFSDVAALTPSSTPVPSQKSITIEHLDRSVDHYFAVVGYNRLGQYVSAVSTVLWKDPYAGTIAENLTIGTGGAPSATYDIYRDILITSNAVLTIDPGVTLRFHAGTGLRVGQGSLSALGTVFNPILLTSAAASPAPGDWTGLYLGPDAGASELAHVWIQYGEGLDVDGCTPSADALSLLYNTPAGLMLEGDATLVTSNLLAQFNAVGLLQQDTAQLAVTQSIVVNNDTNAVAGGANAISAQGIWWGSVNDTQVLSSLLGNVDYAPFLTTEPLLTPAADTADGNHDVGARLVDMKYACRVAESMRISEDSTFTNAFFQDFVPTNTVELSEGGGTKTLYVQFRNVNGETNSPLAVTINYITAGPVIQTFNLVEGQVLQRPAIVVCSAASPLGVASAEFYVDNVLVASTNAGSMNVLWDVREESSGIHRVKFVARDTHGEFTVREANVQVAPEPPPAPSISSPTNGFVTAASSVMISGTAESFIGVRISRNGAFVGETFAGINGGFSLTIDLLEGDNLLSASAFDALGSASSSSLLVVRDTGAPATVTVYPPTFSLGSGILVEWADSSTGEAPSSYRVFWSTSVFSSAAGASATGDVTTVRNYVVEDLPDGHYYFGVVGYDGAGNASEFSNVVEADYDTTPPAFTIGYNKSSPVGAGALHMILTSDESLSGPPDLLVLPYGASGPTLLAVSNTAPNIFEADYNITALTPSGTAQVKVSASDLYGNVFSGTPSGVALSIDTTPPSGSIEIVPSAPVQVLSNATLLVNLQLSEPPKPGTVPLVELDPPAGATVSVAMTGSGTNWNGAATLVPGNGTGFCTFNLSVSDALDNVGSTITSGEELEIYTTALPTPPNAPNLLNPAAVKGGYVNLVWYPVSNAETYSLYRLSGDVGTPTTVVTSGIVSNGIADLPPVDGNYRYAVTAERRGSESGLSTVYTEFSDRTPPGAPSNVVVQLKASGVQVSWTAPTEGDAPIRYNVYRNGTKIGSPYVPTPVTDYPPRGTSSYYVASADWLGNEAFSATNEFSMLVPAVSSFSVLINENQPPQLSWTTGDASIVGVNLYRNGIKLNSTPLTDTSLTDSTYSGSSIVRYTLKSVDNVGQEGPGRVADVYRLDMGLDVNEAGPGLPILRYFDAYNVAVTNRTLAASFPLGSVELRRTYSGAPATTVMETVTNSLPAGSSLDTEVPMASMGSAVAQSVRVRLLQTPDASGAQVTYQRLFSFADALVDNQMVGISVTNTPVAGTLASFKVRVFNRGYADMDAVLFKQNSSQPGDLYVSIRNELGEEISHAQFLGTVSGITVAPDGRGYVTVPPGGYVDVWVTDVLVPISLSTAGSMSVNAGVSTVYHHLGQPDQQVSGPVSGTVQLGLSLTEYYGTSSTDKSGYANDEQIIITGQALRRSDNAVLPDTPLRIGFAMGNYQWSEEVTTDETGSYTYVYDVPNGIAGELTLWAAHPDMVDRLDQNTVSIHRMFVLPRIGDIRMSKNDTYTFSLNLLNPGTLPLSGLGATVRAYRMDGTNEIDIATVTATPQWAPGSSIGSKEKVSFPVELQAAPDAPDNAVVEIRFAAAEGAADTFTANLTLLEAIPIIDIVEPASGYVDVTVNRGKFATKTVTVVNRGLRDYFGVKMSPAANLGWIAPTLVPAGDGQYYLPDLPVGASNTFDVVFAPPEGLAMDRYSDVFVISGTNHPATFNVPLYATVSSADKGDVQLFAQNTLSIPVPGASLRLRNRLLGTELAPVTTGTNGIVLVEGLQEGLWYWQVSAPGHTTQAGSIDVVADQVNEISTRLDKNLVTVTFSVVPVPFTDRYEIVIEQTFETHVPVPVMVVTPSWQSFEDVQAGFQVRFNATVKNHGLIALKELTITGQEFSWGSMVPLVEYLPRLNPFEEVQIPIVVYYYGDGGAAGSQVQRQSAYGDCLYFMLGAIHNFGKNLENLINRFAGEYQCPNSLDPGTANAAVSVLLKIHEWKGSPLPPGTLELAAIIGCAFSGGGDSGGRGSGGPASGGGSSYGPGGAPCLAPDTMVLLADGQRIMASQLAVGDRVRSGYEEHEVAEVADVVHGVGTHWVTLGFADDPEQILNVTAEHMIWIDGEGWVAAKNIKVGDAVFTDGDLRVEVVSVEVNEEERPLVSVRLKGDNAMFADGILVHDQCGWWTPPKEETKSVEVAP